MNTKKPIESEKLLEKKLSEKIKKIGGWSIKLFPIHVSGLPDRLCLLPDGRAFFVEIKTTDKKITPIQKAVHRKLNNMGFIVIVVDTSEQVLEVINQYKIIAGHE